MEEILELKQLLLKGDIRGSLAIVEDLEEMGKKAILKPFVATLLFCYFI